MRLYPRSKDLLLVPLLKTQTWCKPWTFVQSGGRRIRTFVAWLMNTRLLPTAYSTRTSLLYHLLHLHPHEQFQNKKALFGLPHYGSADTFAYRQLILAFSFSVRRSAYSHIIRERPVLTGTTGFEPVTNLLTVHTGMTLGWFAFFHFATFQDGQSIQSSVPCVLTPCDYLCSK